MTDDLFTSADMMTNNCGEFSWRILKKNRKKQIRDFGARAASVEYILRLLLLQSLEFAFPTFHFQFASQIRHHFVSNPINWLKSSD
jgi:hypothetical protein